jgi:DNA-binding response OmpR family regulator
VVEDELLIRLLIMEELTRAGFQVCEAADGEQAAAIMEEPPAEFSLLVTDIHMPGRLDGIQVAQRMRTRFPTVPVLYTTGRPDVLEHVKSACPNEHVLEKPFEPSELLARVRQLLAGKQRAEARTSATDGGRPAAAR